MPYIDIFYLFGWMKQGGRKYPQKSLESPKSETILESKGFKL